MEMYVTIPKTYLGAILSVTDAMELTNELILERIVFSFSVSSFNLMMSCSCAGNVSKHKL